MLPLDELFKLKPIEDRPIITRGSIRRQTLLMVAIPSYEELCRYALISSDARANLPTFEDFCELPVIRRLVQHVAEMSETIYECAPVGYRIVDDV